MLNIIVILGILMVIKVGEIQAIIMFEGVITRGTEGTRDIKDETVRVKTIKENDPMREQKIQGLVRQFELMLEKLLRYKEGSLEVNVVVK